MSRWSGGSDRTMLAEHGRCIHTHPCGQSVLVKCRLDAGTRLLGHRTCNQKPKTSLDTIPRTRFERAVIRTRVNHPDSRPTGTRGTQSAPSRGVGGDAHTSCPTVRPPLLCMWIEKCSQTSSISHGTASCGWGRRRCLSCNWSNVTLVRGATSLPSRTYRAEERSPTCTNLSGLKTRRSKSSPPLRRRCRILPMAAFSSHAAPAV